MLQFIKNEDDLIALCRQFKTMATYVNREIEPMHLLVSFTNYIQHEVIIELDEKIAIGIIENETYYSFNNAKPYRGEN